MTQLYTLLYIVRYTPLILTVATAGSFADKIGPVDNDNVVGKVTDTVTLKYSYESRSSSIWFYWYEQNNHSAPQFLLTAGGAATDTRLKTETTGDSTELTIRGLKLSDSALYHCALRDAMYTQ
ncbi:hypothetical protein C0J50_11264 [Silurus asotus]|uniref:Ig-like domain-containing protein n=1 Tax=Silurus asotus TaxID=30991 RepID=A0AAD5AE17_SILAS|nr:hypothetical protein C0J50_11264 [Silurus asotus]